MGEEWRSLVESSLKQDHTAAAPSDPLATVSDTLQTLPSQQQQQQQLDMDDLMLSRVDRMDVLKELEDIASMTIAETGFFCK